MVTFKDLNKNYIAVFIDGKTSGCIKRVSGGFQYRPKKSKQFGDTFATKEMCKNSLLSDFE